jgi:sugar lactone lactonase YvrE
MGFVRDSRRQDQESGMNTAITSGIAVSMAALVGVAVHDSGLSARVLRGLETVTVIASSLDNPRGLAFGPDGALYVAEAGSGGAGPCAEGPEGLRCYGATGSIARIDLSSGTLTRVASGLPSAASGDGSFATGPHDVSFQGLGNAFITIGYGGDPSNRTTDFGPAGAAFARLVRLTANGVWTLEEDLGNYEAAANPTGDEVDSNPYGVLALPGGRVVVDAGANALNAIGAQGVSSTLATFPNSLAEAPAFLGLPPGTLIEMDAVPTSGALGPDGRFYIGQLTGFPFPVGGANIFRVAAHGGTPEIFASGFTAVVDVAFGPDGSLYVLELAKDGLLAAFIENDWTGALVRIAPDGSRTEIAPGTLFAPGGLAVGADGAVYVSNNSIFSGTGQVIRIEP